MSSRLHHIKTDNVTIHEITIPIVNVGGRVAGVGAFGCAAAVVASAAAKSASASAAAVAQWDNPSPASCDFDALAMS